MEALLQGAGGHSEALRSPLDPRNKKSRFGVFETNQKAIFLNRQITLSPNHRFGVIDHVSKKHRLPLSQWHVLGYLRRKESDLLPKEGRGFDALLSLIGPRVRLHSLCSFY